MIVLRDDHAIDRAALAELYRAVGWGERAEPELLEAVLRGSRWVASAWDGARLVGFARAISDGVTTAYVTDVMVAESDRRRGIATALVKRLMAGREEIHFVLRAQPEHHPLYAKVGFVPAPTMLRRPRAR